MARKGSKKSKKKSKSKKKTRAQRRPKSQSDLDKIKKMESDLYESCMKDVENIVRQSGLETHEVLEFIEKNGINRVKIIKGFEMSDPIFEMMLKNWNTLGQVKIIRERMEKANRKLFIREMQQQATILDEKVKKIEDEEKFYTTAPDKEGKVHLREKYFAEMEYWNEKLATAKTPEQYKEAQNQIKKLKGKKTWMHMKNLMPNVTKWSKKISGGIATVQDSMGEISKPFQDMGGDSFKKAKGNSNDFGFNEKSVFSGVPSDQFSKKKSKAKEPDPFGGF